MSAYSINEVVLETQPDTEVRLILNEGYYPG